MYNIWDLVIYWCYFSFLFFIKYSEILRNCCQESLVFASPNANVKVINMTNLI